MFLISELCLPPFKNITQDEPFKNYHLIFLTSKDQYELAFSEQSFIKKIIPDQYMNITEMSTQKIQSVWNDEESEYFKYAQITMKVSLTTHSFEIQLPLLKII